MFYFICAQIDQIKRITQQTSSKKCNVLIALKMTQGFVVVFQTIVMQCQTTLDTNAL